MGIDWQTDSTTGDGVINKWTHAEDGPHGSRIVASIDPYGEGFSLCVWWGMTAQFDLFRQGQGMVQFTLERVHKTSEAALATAVRCIAFLRDLAAVNPGIVFRAQQAVNGGHDAAGT